MILIAHRGNIDGPNPEMENNPQYIDKAIDSGYNVEIDVRGSFEGGCSWATTKLNTRYHPIGFLNDLIICGCMQRIFKPYMRSHSKQEAGMHFGTKKMSTL